MGEPCGWGLVSSLKWLVTTLVLTCGALGHATRPAASAAARAVPGLQAGQQRGQPGCRLCCCQGCCPRPWASLLLPGLQPRLQLGLLLAPWTGAWELACKSKWECCCWTPCLVISTAPYTSSPWKVLLTTTACHQCFSCRGRLPQGLYCVKASPSAAQCGPTA